MDPFQLINRETKHIRQALQVASLLILCSASSMATESPLNSTDEALEAVALSAVAQTSQKAGNHHLAAHTSAKAAEIYIGLNDNTAAGSAQSTAGESFSAVGKHEQAAHHYGQAALSYGVGFKPSATIEAHLSAATAHKLSGSFLKAGDAYACAARAQVTWSKYREAGESFQLAAHAYTTAGQKNKAIEHLLASAAAYGQGGDAIAEKGSRLAAAQLKEQVQVALVR